MREILASIDIGSSKIKLVVAEISNEDMYILCALEEDSRGVRNGLICEPEETEYAIQKLLKKGEEMLNAKISKAIVSVSEGECDFQIGEASITITQEDKEITTDDIVRVLQTSVKGHVRKEFELVTVIPIMFKVDDRKTQVPKNIKGDSLSVKSVVVTAPKKDVYLAARCVEKCGVEVIDIMTNSIGNYYAYDIKDALNTTGIIVDIGADTSTISVFNKGIIINNLVMNMGGSKIDNDISFVYKVSSEQAINIKEKLALANKKNASVKEKENYTNKLGENIEINQFEVSEVAMSRIHELLQKIKNEINHLTKKEISYIIITGGLTEMKDFELEVESVFGNSAYIGKINTIGARNNKYASCIGMIKYFDDKLKLRDKECSVISDDDLEVMSGSSNKKMLSGDSILGKVFGMFFDND